MASFRYKRQAATAKGILRRLKAGKLHLVTDPRQAGKVEFSLVAILRLMIVAAASGARSQRDLEDRSEQLQEGQRNGLEVRERIADNTFGGLLPRIASQELRESLQASIKAEHRRGNLAPDRFEFGVLAVDGKHIATTPWWALRQLVLSEYDRRQSSKEKKNEQVERELSDESIVALARQWFPELQLHVPESGTPYGLLRVHRSTLVSGAAAVCVDQQVIAGNTNELGAIEQTLAQVIAAYRNTSLFDLLTLDAGNVSLAVANAIRAASLHYFLALKETQPGLHAEAEKLLGGDPGRLPDQTWLERRDGKDVFYQIWQVELPDGHLAWTHARQLVRVERIVTDADDNSTCGNRYFVSSMPTSVLGAEAARRLARMHWRCENEGHWTSDAILDEDARRTPWSRHPNGIVIASLLRMFAQNILAVLRSLSRIGAKLIKPKWKTVIDSICHIMFDALLDTTVFDAFEA